MKNMIQTYEQWKNSISNNIELDSFTTEELAHMIGFYNEVLKQIKTHWKTRLEFLPKA